MEAHKEEIKKTFFNPAVLPIRPKDRTLLPPILVTSTYSSNCLFQETNGQLSTDGACHPTTRIIIGGFGPLPPREFRPETAFPPPPNSAYFLDSNGHGPKCNDQEHTYGQGLDSAYVCKSQHSRVSSETDQNLLFPIDDIQGGEPPSQGKERLVSEGQVLAESINFNRPPWISRLPELPRGQSFYPPKQQREDFVKTIASGEPFIFCTKCKQSHIPPGPPLTLQDRDTCGSMLPRWFPAAKFKAPWDAFTNLLNQHAECVEDLRYLDSKESSDGPQWDMEWHPHNLEWKEIGRKAEGWWKCRSGTEAPEQERQCRRCHQRQTEEKSPRLSREQVLKKKLAIEKFIETCVEKEGRRDREVVEAQWHACGIPQHYGPPLDTITGKRYGPSSSD